MLFKNNKIIICLSAAAVMSMGGVTAFAAAPDITLTPATNVDVSKIDAQKGQYEIAGNIDPEILEGLKGAKTAPGLTLTAVPVSFDTANVQKGEYIIVNNIDPKTFSGTGKTAPGPVAY